MIEQRSRSREEQLLFEKWNPIIEGLYEYLSKMTSWKFKLTASSFGVSWHLSVWMSTHYDGYSMSFHSRELERIEEEGLGYAEEAVVGLFIEAMTKLVRDVVGDAGERVKAIRRTKALGCGAKVITINVAVDFGTTPGGRYLTDGPHSGQEFRAKFLEEHFRDPKAGYHVQIILDGVEGYSNSFLEEAFGGLARIFGRGRVFDRLHFVSEDDPLLVDDIRRCIKESD